MDFVRWPSIENSYREQFIDRALEQYPELADEIYVVTEKLHGANVQLAFSLDGKLYVGSRNRFLDREDKFYGVWDVIDAQCGGVIDLFAQQVKKHGHSFRLFGELYGGGIQKGVRYQEEHRIAFFGAMRDDALRPYFELENTARWYFDGMLAPRVAVVEGLNTALEYGAEFDSKILGIGDNICEGIVIQPYRKVYTLANGSTFILKKKNEAFKQAPREKRPSRAPEEIQSLGRAFHSYITDARLQGIFSKYGLIKEPKQIGQYIGYMLQDAKHDFLKDYPRAADLTKGEQRIVFSVGSVIANMLKEYL